MLIQPFHARQPRPQVPPRTQRPQRGEVDPSLSPRAYNAARLKQLAGQPQKRVKPMPANKATIARYAASLKAISAQAYAIVNRTVIAAIEQQNELAESVSDAAMTTREKIRAFLQGRIAAKRAIRAAAQDVPHTPDEKEQLDMPPEVAQAIRDMDAQIAAMVRALGDPQVAIGVQVMAETAAQNAATMQTLGLRVIDPGSALERASVTWTKNNASLIKSIPTDMAERVRQKVVEMVPQGARWETIAKQLRQEEGIGRRRAELIARDQVGKYHADLSQTRMQACGIQWYEWSGAQDNRERASHLALQGTVWSFDKPPPIGNAGTPIRCRCVCIPLTSAAEIARYRPMTDADLQARMVAIGPRDDDPPDTTKAQLQARSARELKSEQKQAAEYNASRNV